MNPCLFENALITYWDFPTETERTLKSGMHKFSKTYRGHLRTLDARTDLKQVPY